MSDDRQPILTITTSKNWVLPPRPKNARKPKATPDKKKTRAAPTPAPAPTPAVDSADDLTSNLRIITRENYQLKTKLLLLIHDYKSLRVLVMLPAAATASPPDLYESASTARKRLFTELDPQPELPDDMSALIDDMNELSYKSPQALSPGREHDVFGFVNLDTDAMFDEDLDDELDTHLLSRLVSPTTSEADENLLMTSLTRSTTVSTNNSALDKKPALFFKFYDLPSYSEEDYAFLFEHIDPHDKMMSVIEEDHYNQVADFLEEKLMSNDVKYYVEKSQLGR